MSIFIRELSYLLIRKEKTQFLALNSSSSTTQSPSFRQRAWSAVGMIRHCHANYSHKKFTIKYIENPELWVTFSVLSLSQLCLHHTKVTPATSLPAAQLSVPLGALWGWDSSPFCSTEIFLLLDFALVQQNPKVFHKPMQRRKMAKSRCMKNIKTNKQTET